MECLRLPGLAGGPVGAAEGVRTERVRVQDAHGRVGEAEPGHSRVDGVREPLHAVHDGDAASRMGTAAHFHQPQHQRS